MESVLEHIPVVLRTCITVGILIVIAGAIVREKSISSELEYIGLVVITITPPTAMFLLTIDSIAKKNYKKALQALLLISIIIVSTILSLTL